MQKVFSSLKARERLAIWMFAVFIMLPTYRPYLIDLGSTALLYSVFVLGGAAYALVAVQIHTIPLRWIDYLVHVFFIAFGYFSVLGTGTPPWGEVLLVGFLYASYMFGRFVGHKGATNQFAVIAGLIFVPISFYVLQQLALNGFSYSTYLKWSNASFKLGYLEFALYGTLLFVLAHDSTLSLKYRLLLCAYLFAVVAISGARYSILFLGLTVAFRLALAMRHGKLIDATIVLTVVSVATVGLLYLPQRFAIDSDPLEHSAHRISSMFHEDQSVRGRVSIIQRSTHAIAAEPWFGYGIGRGGEAIDANYPHNIVLETCLDAGIPAGILLSSILLTFGCVGLRLVPAGAISIGIATIYLLGAYLKSFTFYEARVLFFMIGIAATTRSRLASEPNSPSHRSMGSEHRAAWLLRNNPGQTRLRE